MTWCEQPTPSVAISPIAFRENIFLISGVKFTGATDESNVNVPNPPLHDPSAYLLILGTTDLSSPNAEFNGASQVFFREYSTSNDLAMLKVSRKITLDGVTKAVTRLPTSANYSPASGTKTYVDGWGMNPQGTTHLLRANIHTLSPGDCGASAYQICTLGQGDGAGPCQV